jgi:hypothetical protein
VAADRNDDLHGGLFALLSATSVLARRRADDQSLRQHNGRTGDHSRHDLKGGARPLLRYWSQSDHSARAQSWDRRLLQTRQQPPRRGAVRYADLLTPFNYHHGIVKGVETLLSYEVGDWSFYGNFAASKALGKGITSSQFNFSPEDLAFIAGHYIHLDHDQIYTYSSGVKYRMPTTRTLFSADLIAASGQRATNPGDTPNGHSLPSYQQVNLSVVQPIETGLYKGMELRFDLLNVFDQVYQIRNGSGVGVGNPLFGLRRTFLAGLTQRL